MGREKYTDIGTDSGADTDIHPHTIIPVTGCQTAKQEFGTLQIRENASDYFKK